jgi:hypothetical protein
MAGLDPARTHSEEIILLIILLIFLSDIKKELSIYNASAPLLFLIAGSFSEPPQIDSDLIRLSGLTLRA